MVKKSITIMTLALVFSTLCQAQSRKIINLQSWDFSRDGKSWSQVSVPHDWAISGPFDKKWDLQKVAIEQNGETEKTEKSGRSGALPWIGEGMYKLNWTAPKGYQRAVLIFDGAMSQPVVTVNGKEAGKWAYGYNAFRIDITPYIRFGKSNVIDVHLNNVEESSRWYPGGGLYRPVTVELYGKENFSTWDTYVRTLKASKEEAELEVNALLQGKLGKGGKTVIALTDANGKKVAEQTINGATPAIKTTLKVATPQLWSPESPYLYKVSLIRYEGKKVADVQMVKTGIRTISVSKQEGFQLNGVTRKIKGVCLHHDLGPLGAAENKAALIRQIKMMKQMGCDAIRTAHNMPSTLQMELCDSLGMMVMAESFDMWIYPKCKNGYAKFFKEWSDKDITNLVKHHRNHPSIIMWSIGNEIAQRADIPRGKEIALNLNLAVNENDHTRPTTMAINSFWDRPQFTWEKDSHRAFDYIEVGGYNYEWKHYEADHDSFPDRIMYGSESFPKEMAHNWNLVDKHPYILGDFVWTAIDYVGEAGLGHTYERSDNRWIQFLSWPWFNAWCGDLDLIGDKKPQSYYRDVLWNRSKLAMAVRPSVPDGEYEDVNGWGWTAEENHWNFGKAYLPIELRPENYQTSNVVGNLKHNVNGHRSDSLRVNVYSREPRVRLLINDSIMGEKDTDPETYTATFTVAYEPGSLKAITLPQAKKAKPDSLEFITALPPARLTLKADRVSISSSHNDLAYITICVEDEEGHLCPTAEIPVEITVSGPAAVVAGTGHPYDMHSFRSLRPTTFRGKALAIVQPQDQSGEVTLTVRAEGLEEAQITIEMK